MTRWVRLGSFVLLSIIIIYYLVTNIEAFENSTIADGFCEHHRGSLVKLNESCLKLSQSNCGKTSCCVWTNQCVSGSKNGPTYNTNAKGKTKQLDSYYFQNKCYGDKCAKM